MEDSEISNAERCRSYEECNNTERVIEGCGRRRLYRLGTRNIETLNDEMRSNGSIIVAVRFHVEQFVRIILGLRPVLLLILQFGGGVGGEDCSPYGSRKTQ